MFSLHRQKNSQLFPKMYFSWKLFDSNAYRSEKWINLSFKINNYFWHILEVFCQAGYKEMKENTSLFMPFIRNGMEAVVSTKHAY